MNNMNIKMENMKSNKLLKYVQSLINNNYKLKEILIV